MLRKIKPQKPKENNEGWRLDAPWKEYVVQETLHGQKLEPPLFAF